MLVGCLLLPCQVTHFTAILKNKNKYAWWKRNQLLCSGKRWRPALPASVGLSSRPPQKGCSFPSNSQHFSHKTCLGLGAEPRPSFCRLGLEQNEAKQPGRAMGPSPPLLPHQEISPGAQGDTSRAASIAARRRDMATVCSFALQPGCSHGSTGSSPCPRAAQGGEGGRKKRWKRKNREVLSCAYVRCSAVLMCWMTSFRIFPNGKTQSDFESKPRELHQNLEHVT